MTKAFNEKTVGDLFDIKSDLAIYSKPESLIMPDIASWGDNYCEEFVPMVDEGYKFNPPDLRLLMIGLLMKIPTYLYGHAGVGKTSMIEQFCARTKRPFMRVQHTVGLEESSVVGQWVVKNGETVFELGPLPYAMKHGMVYCADEYDFAEPAVLSIYQSVLEGKPLIIKEADLENRVIKPHPNFRFCATGNTNGAGDSFGLYQGTRIQNVANYERFGIVHRVDFLPESVEREILLTKSPIGELKNETIKKNMLDAIMKFAKKTREKSYESNSEDTLPFGPSIRVLLNVANLGWQLGDFGEAFKIAYINRMSAVEQDAAIKVLNQYVNKDIYNKV